MLIQTLFKWVRGDRPNFDRPKVDRLVVKKITFPKFRFGQSLL